MAILSVRQLPFALADGPTNMAADETMLVSAANGTASFRLYGWSEPTLSLGYFQPQVVRQHHPKLASLPFVRRPSGGLTLVHHYELTYALALPESHHQSLPHPIWLSKHHQLIVRTLAEFGVTAKMAEEDGPEIDDPLCFKHITKGDLLIQNEKVVGSAQRKLRGALLQHGGILLAQSPLTPTLPGIAELTGTPIELTDLCDIVGLAVRRETAWKVHDGEWTDEELTFTQKSIRDKYSQKKWNEKR